MQNIRSHYSNQQVGYPSGYDKDIHDDIFQQFVLAMKMGRKGYYQQAELLLLPLLNTEHYLRSAVIDLLVRVYVQQGQIGKAEHILQEAIHLMPHNKGFYNLLIELQRGLFLGQYTWIFKKAFILVVYIAVILYAFILLSSIRTNQNNIINDIDLMQSNVSQIDNAIATQFQVQKQASEKITDKIESTEQQNKQSVIELSNHITSFQQKSQESLADIFSKLALVQQENQQNSKNLELINELIHTIQVNDITQLKTTLAQVDNAIVIQLQVQKQATEKMSDRIESIELHNKQSVVEISNDIAVFQRQSQQSLEKIISKLALVQQENQQNSQSLKSIDFQVQEIQKLIDETPYISMIRFMKRLISGE